MMLMPRLSTRLNEQIRYPEFRNFYIPAVGLNYPIVKSGSIQVGQCDTQQWMPLSAFPERRIETVSPGLL